MAFEQQVNITKTAIGDFEIVFFVPQIINAENPQTGELNVQIVLSNGSTENVSFDLLARLADDAPGLVHLTNLASLRDYIRTRLNAEVLPP